MQEPLLRDRPERGESENEEEEEAEPIESHVTSKKDRGPTGHWPTKTARLRRVVTRGGVPTTLARCSACGGDAVRVMLAYAQATAIAGGDQYAESCERTIVFFANCGKITSQAVAATSLPGRAVRR
jgi:hypothetical protein